MKFLPTRRVRHPATIVFALKVADMVRRGDIDLVVDSLKGYWRDKKAYPWHRIWKDLAQKGIKTLSEKEITECIGLLRDGLFAALDILSLSIPLNITTRELLDIVLKPSSWKAGRRAARNYCENLVKEMIDAGKTDMFVLTGLEHDGFRYLVPDIMRKRLEIFEAARPELKGDSYDLKPLRKCVLGCLLLRQLDITDTKLAKDDPRVEELLTLHSHTLLDMELEESSYVIDPEATAQVTLNGEIIEDVEEPEESTEPKTPPEEADVQVPLTEYISKDKASTTKKQKKRKKSGSKKKITKKKTTTKRRTSKRPKSKTKGKEEA
ncbi:MAG: hypothetical protein ACTSYL_03140 [Candidatus Thorarchaeota archaeon]